MRRKLGKWQPNSPERRVLPCRVDRDQQYQAQLISFLTISKRFETKYRYRSKGRRLQEDENKYRQIVLFDHLRETREDAGERTLKEGVSLR